MDRNNQIMYQLCSWIGEKKESPGDWTGIKGTCCIGAHLRPLAHWWSPNHRTSVTLVLKKTQKRTGKLQ